MIRKLSSFRSAPLHILSRAAADMLVVNWRAAVAVLVVNVLDVNDERPRFLADRYSFHVLENSPAGSLVGVVSARDDDGAPYNQFTLSLLPAGSLSDAFSIDPLSGRLFTTRPLDRERQVRTLYSLFHY